MCCETLKANVKKNKAADIEVVRDDIRTLADEPWRLPKRIDFVIGGPPCQTFSASGRRAGGAPGTLDKRGTLFEAYCRIIGYLKPKGFLFENVRGILSTNEGRDWKTIVQSFEQIGYQISYRILDALDYGAPQQRERMLMVGRRLGAVFLFPEPLYGPDSANQLPHVTAGEALQNLKDEEDLEPLFLRNGKYSHLLPLVPPGENYLFFTAKRGYKTPIFAYRSRFSDFLYKANPKAPIKTIIARPGKYTGPLHWENRYFTVAEYKRLQGFPDEYIFVGGRDEAIKQIGNSVSPKLAYQLALSISKQIFQRDVDVRLLSENKTLSFDSRKGVKARRTRAYHDSVLIEESKSSNGGFKFENYTAMIEPVGNSSSEPNAIIKATGKHVTITVHADASRSLFAKMELAIHKRQTSLLPELNNSDAYLKVIAYGKAEHTVQTMWNAVDYWVTRSSNFHSLFELYGHFTEPHPIFRVTEFHSYTKHPIAAFAKHCASFENCSKHFPREHLTDLFGIAFGKKSFVELVKTLRSYRYDIRCLETNITMPENVYMVAYPFALPYGKQMNFSVNLHEINRKGRKNGPRQFV